MMQGVWRYAQGAFHAQEATSLENLSGPARLVGRILMFRVNSSTASLYLRFPRGSTMFWAGWGERNSACTGLGANVTIQANS